VLAVGPASQKSKDNELVHTVKIVCCPCLAESADDEYSDAHLSEVRLPMRPPRTTSCPNWDFGALTGTSAPAWRLSAILHHSMPLSEHPGCPNLSSCRSPATCRIPSARGNSPAAQRCPPCPALAYLAQNPAGATRRPQRPLLVCGFRKVATTHQDVEDFG